MSQEEINISLFDEVKRLKAELTEKASTIKQLEEQVREKDAGIQNLKSWNEIQKEKLTRATEVMNVMKEALQMVTGDVDFPKWETIHKALATYDEFLKN